MQCLNSVKGWSYPYSHMTMSWVNTLLYNGINESLRQTLCGQVYNESSRQSWNICNLKQNEVKWYGRLLCRNPGRIAHRIMGYKTGGRWDAEIKKALGRLPLRRNGQPVYSENDVRLPNYSIWYVMVQFYVLNFDISDNNWLHFYN
jgi:hypothetical protein